VIKIKAFCRPKASIPRVHITKEQQRTEEQQARKNSLMMIDCAKCYSDFLSRAPTIKLFPISVVVPACRDKDKEHYLLEKMEKTKNIRTIHYPI